MCEQTLNKLRFTYQIALGTKEKSSILDEISIRILKAIVKIGSLNFALILEDVSYRNGWGRIRNMEKELGLSLVTSICGGAEGGSPAHTREGKALIDAYDGICEEIGSVLQGNTNRVLYTQKPKNGESGC